MEARKKYRNKAKKFAWAGRQQGAAQEFNYSNPCWLRTSQHLGYLLLVKLGPHGPSDHDVMHYHPKDLFLLILYGLSTSSVIEGADARKITFENKNLYYQKADQHGPRLKENQRKKLSSETTFT